MENVADQEPVEYQSGEQLFAFRNGKLVPVNLKLPGRTPKYPLHRLEVGQSFFVPFEEKKPHPIKQIYHRAKRLDIEVKQKVLTEQGRPGVRVWRVK